MIENLLKLYLYPIYKVTISSHSCFVLTLITEIALPDQRSDCHWTLQLETWNRYKKNCSTQNHCFYFKLGYLIAASVRAQIRINFDRNALPTLVKLIFR